MVVLAHHALWDLPSKANNLVQRIQRLPLSPPPWDMVWFPRGRTDETLVSTSPGEPHVLWGKGTFPRGTLLYEKQRFSYHVVPQGNLTLRKTLFFVVPPEPLLYEKRRFVPRVTLWDYEKQRFRPLILLRTKGDYR